MTRLYHHYCDSGAVPLAQLRATAARSGALLETPTTLRAGFGDVIETASSTDLSALTGAIFDSVAVTLDSAAPSGTGPWAMTQHPFERDAPSHAWLYETSVVVDGESAWITSVHSSCERALSDLFSVDVVLSGPYPLGPLTHRPTSEQYGDLVATAVDAIRSGGLDKVVLGRRTYGAVRDAIDAAVAVTRLREREPACAIYAVPVDTGRFVGASPELLLSVIDGAVTAHPLAGTIALDNDDEISRGGSSLLDSSKNQFEHRVVVDDIVAALSPFCQGVHADASPSMVVLHSIAHLGTWVHAKTDPARHVEGLEMLSALYPTPAVGGRPARVAAVTIAELEGEPRGHFAGAIGWCDAVGNGEWWITIRGVLIDGCAFTAWAGAGIVADSDPDAEREETRNKLNAILVGLGEIP